MNVENPIIRLFLGVENLEPGIDRDTIKELCLLPKPLYRMLAAGQEGKPLRWLNVPIECEPKS